MPTRSSNRKDGPLTEHMSDPVARAAELLAEHRDSIDRQGVTTIGDALRSHPAIWGR